MAHANVFIDSSEADGTGERLCLQPSIVHVKAGLAGTTFELQRHYPSTTLSDAYEQVLDKADISDEERLAARAPWLAGSRMALMALRSDSNEGPNQSCSSGYG